MPDYHSVYLDEDIEEALIPSYHIVVVLDGSTGGDAWECGKLSHLIIFLEGLFPIADDRFREEKSKRKCNCGGRYGEKYLVE